MPKIAQQCTEHLRGSGWQGSSSGLPARLPHCYCGYQRPVVPMPTRPLMHAWQFLTSFCGCFEQGKNPRAMPALTLRQKVCEMLGHGKEQLVALLQILTSLCLVADTTLSPSREGTPLPRRGNTGKSQKQGVLVALTKEVALWGAFTSPIQRGTYVATPSSMGLYSKFNIKILLTEQRIIIKTKSTTLTFGTLQVPSCLCVSKSALMFPVGASAPPVPCPCTQFMPCTTLQHHAACAGHSRIRNGVGENKPNAANDPSHPCWLKQHLA